MPMHKERAVVSIISWVFGKTCLIKVSRLKELLLNRDDQNNYKSLGVYTGVLKGLERFMALCKCLNSYTKEIKSGNYKECKMGTAYRSKMMQNTYIWKLITKSIMKRSIPVFPLCNVFWNSLFLAIQPHLKMLVETH